MTDPLTRLADLATDLWHQFETAPHQHPRLADLLDKPRDPAMFLFAARMLAERDCPIIHNALEHVDRMRAAEGRRAA